MRILAPILLIISLVMVCFTDPNGFAAWVDREQVVTVTHPLDCVSGANAKVSTGNGTFLCVRETVKEAIERLDGKKPAVIPPSR